MYLSDDPEEQKRTFLKKGLSREADRIARQKGLPVEKWCFPLGFVKWKPSVSRSRYLLHLAGNLNTVCIGWFLLLAADEVGSTTILRHQANVGNIE